MVKFKGINHLAMITGDMDRTIHFWRDIVGFRLAAGMGKPGYRQYFFEISETDLLAFFEWPGVEPVEEKDHGYPLPGRVVFDHIAFGVDTQDDLWELRDRLDAADFPVSGVIDHGFIHSFYSWDPNGIPIEFSVDLPEFDIRKEPLMVDKNPTPAALEGPEPQVKRRPTPSRTTPREERHIYPGAGSEAFKAYKNKKKD